MQARRFVLPSTPRTVAVSVLGLSVVLLACASGAASASGEVRSKGGWRQLPAPPVRVLSGQSATLLADGRVLVAGGCVKTSKSPQVQCLTSTASAQIFDPDKGSWSKTSPMSQARIGHTSTLLPAGPASICASRCGQVLVFGGASGNFGEIYDPRRGRWSKTAGKVPVIGAATATRLPDGPAELCGCSCGKVLIVGSGGIELFNPRTGGFESAPEPLDHYSIHTAALLRTGEVLVMRGQEFGATELFNPRSARWTSTPGKEQAGSNLGFPTSTRLPDGRVLVTGDLILRADYQARFANLYAPEVEIYDPDRPADPNHPEVGRGAWLIAGELLGPRRSHTATVLSDGKVLIVGGSTPVNFLGGEGVVKTVRAPFAELWDPKTERSKAVLGQPQGMRPTMSGHTATLLKDGRVLIVGDRRAALYVPSGWRAPEQAFPWWVRAGAGSLAFLLAAVFFVILRRPRQRS